MRLAPKRTVRFIFFIKIFFYFRNLIAAILQADLKSAGIRYSYTRGFVLMILYP